MLLQGTILRNRYKIVSHLGSGGFADTYLAEDRDLPGNPKCVVKNLKPTSPDPAVLPIARRLFETEAQMLYYLGQHEQIPRLFAHFEENGEFYLVQEFIDGHDLSKEFTPGKRFSEEKVTNLLQKILEVLLIVHQRSIIHRDIKPQNIMLRRSDGMIFLIDFGAVKEIGSLAINTSGQVTSTIAIGTPGYMPNEQAYRNPQLSSDIYAVGMIGIQALTGLLPQQFLLDPTTGELIWRNYVQVSNNLADVLTKMVSYHFSKRYHSASEALQAVNTLILQPPKKPPTSIPRISQIPKPLLWGGLIGLSGLLTGIIATVALLNHPQPQSQSSTSSLPVAGLSASEPTRTSETFPIPIQKVQFAIQPKYDWADGFSDGLARIRIDGKVGFIDKNGDIVIQPKFDDTKTFSDGLALAWISGQNWGFINKTGQFAIPTQFAKNDAHNFSDGLARACLVRTCGYIDKSGRFVIERKYAGAGGFKDGLAAVKLGGKWGYIDKNGKVIIPIQFDKAGNFSEGFAQVSNGSKWGYIDNNGKVAINLQFDRNYAFSEDLAVFKIGNKFGYIDKSGKIIAQAQFDSSFNFSDGMGVVKVGKQFGYIDKAGRYAIPLQFDEAYSFTEGLAGVKVGNKWGYINKSGNFVIEPQFDEAYIFIEGVAVVKSDGKYGYIRNPLK